MIGFRASRAPAILSLLCVSAFLGLFVRQGLEDAGRQSLATSFDFHSYFLPRMVLGARTLLQGELPLWNPYEYGGIPLLATSQPALLYPPTVFFFGILPEQTALWAFIAFHFLLLAATFLSFLKAEGLVGVPAWVGVALWLFASQHLLTAYAPIRIANVVWVPLTFLLVNRIALGAGRRSVAALALVVAIQITAGYPEFTLDTALLVAAHATASWWTGRWQRPPWQTLPPIAAGFALGAVAAAAHLAPLAELALMARRGQVAAEPYRGHISAIHGLLTVVPGLIPFAIIGLTARAGRVPAIGMIICWLISQGGWLFLRRLPMFAMSRFPYVWVLLGGFYFAWLGAVGAAEVLRAGAPTTFRRSLSVSGLCVTGLVLASTAVAFRFRRGGLSSSADGELARYLTSPAASVLLVGGGLALSVAGFLLFLRRRPSWLWLGATTLLTLSHAAAFPFGGVSAPVRRPSAVGRVASLHGNARAIRGRAISLDDLLYGYEITDRVRSAFGIEASFLPYRYRRLAERFRFIPLFASLDWPRLLDAGGWLNAMDVQFVAADATQTALFAAHDWRLVTERDGLSLFENERRMGGAWINHSVHRVESETEALDYVSSPSFDPRREVVLEQETEHLLPGSMAETTTVPVATHRSSQTDIEFAVALDRPGVLVVSESAYPGWEASIDGVPARVLTADYVLRAVEVPSGSHTVRFRYRPMSVRLGFALSAVGLLAIGMLARRQRHAVGGVRPNPAA